MEHVLHVSGLRVDADVGPMIAKRLKPGLNTRRTVAIPADNWVGFHSSAGRIGVIFTNRKDHPAPWKRNWWSVGTKSSAPKEGILPVRIVKEIWREITFGVGTWGALRPLVATAVLATVPFLFLGQHFNRQHRRGFGGGVSPDSVGVDPHFVVSLYLWSIFDAWRDAVGAMGQVQGQS